MHVSSTCIELTIIAPPSIIDLVNGLPKDLQEKVLGFIINMSGIKTIGNVFLTSELAVQYALQICS